jgi:PKD repeat protein
MKTIKTLSYMVVIAVAILSASCAKEVEVPVANFSAESSVIDAGKSVRFTCSSSNEPDTRDWVFPGATPAVGSGSSVSVVYETPGIYEVTLTVTNEAGSDMITKSVEVVTPTYDVTFHNNAPTTVHLYAWIGWQLEEAEINSGESYVLKDLAPGVDVDYSVYAYGETSSGTRIGETIEWEGEYNDLSGDRAAYLDVDSEYFYLSMTNEGYTDLENLYVNYELQSETYDGIVIPNDMVEYGIGYYKAWANTNVRMYIEGTDTFVFWEQGVDFDLPWTNNQTASLVSSYNKSTMGPKPYRGTTTTNNLNIKEGANKTYAVVK